MNTQQDTSNKMKTPVQKISLLLLLLISTFATADDSRFSKDFNQMRLQGILSKPISVRRHPNTNNQSNTYPSLKHTDIQSTPTPLSINGLKPATGLNSTNNLKTQVVNRPVNNQYASSFQLLKYSETHALTLNKANTTKINHAQNNVNIAYNHADTTNIRSNSNNSNNNISTRNSLSAVDFTNIHINKPMLASMHAVSEICLQLLPSRLHPKFEQAFEQRLQQYFPNISNPKSAMQYLANQSDYQQLLNSWKHRYSEAENIALCEEMVNDKYK